MKVYAQLLRGIGLSETAALIYGELLEHGESTISEIATKTLQHRMEIYRHIPILLESGLVICTHIGKKKVYRAEDPRIIQELYEEQQERYNSHIERLREMYHYLGKKPKMTYKEGKAGIAFVFSDIVASLKVGEVFYRISSERDVSQADRYLPKDYRKKRDEKQLERYVIMSEEGAKYKLPRLERDIVTIPKEFDEFGENISLTIYGNKIAYIDFSTETSIIIEKKELADFQRKIFILLFKSLNH